MMKKNSVIFILFFFFLLIFMLTGCTKTEINLVPYFNIEYEGVSGWGTGSPFIIDPIVMESELSDKMRSQESYETFINNLIWEITPSVNLTNGETVTLIFSIDESIINSLNISFLNGLEHEFPVNGLIDYVTSIDVASLLSINIQGLSGWGVAEIISENLINTIHANFYKHEIQRDIESAISWSVNKDKGLSNGDIIQLSIDYNIPMLTQNGIVATGNSVVEIIVENLEEPSYIIDVLSLLEVEINGLSGFGHADINSYNLLEFLDDTFQSTDDIDFIISSLSIEMSQSSELRNGDNLSLIINVNDELLAKHGIAVTHNREKDILIESLIEPTIINLDSVFDINFDGKTGSGIGSATIKSSFLTERSDDANVLSSIGWDLSPSRNLSNGDSIILSLKANERIIDDLFERGIILEGSLEQQIRVTGLTELTEFERFQLNALRPSYDDLIRYPDTYKDEPIRIRVKIIDINVDRLFGLIQGGALGRMSGNDIVIFDSREDREPRLREGDTVVIYGDGGGLHKMQRKRQGIIFDRVVDEWYVPKVYIKFLVIE